MGYLTNRYKGKYRLLCEYDENNQFPTKLDGTYEDIDVYISCQKNIKVFHRGRGILNAYIPSLQRGHNIVKDIKNKYGDIIFNIEESDSEVLFDFKASDDEKVFEFIIPKTSGARISPFSSKNLPKTNYTIPLADIELYKEITKNFDLNSGDWLKMSRITNEFIKSMSNKKHTLESIKADIKKSGLKNREYIHSIGKWEDYIKYIKENV